VPSCFPDARREQRGRRGLESYVVSRTPAVCERLGVLRQQPEIAAATLQKR
jgi:hypothetical protein